jgi:hypothetical protein
MGFLTIPSMRVSLPLNQILALVVCGLCDSKVVMIFWNFVLWLHFWFSVVVILRLLDLKRLFVWYLLWVIVRGELLSKGCSESCFAMVLFSPSVEIGYQSLLKLQAW